VGRVQTRGKHIVPKGRGPSRASVPLTAWPLAPDPGTYVAECSFFEREWQRAYWGPNYPKLLAIKKKCDPTGLFFVHHGVGSEEWSADGFTRLAGP
jgi:hypothetical protein